MINFIKKNIGNIYYYVFVAVCLWGLISSFIQMFMCPEMTQTEIILQIPKSFMCDWVYCN